MVLHVDIERPGQAWLRAAFARTRLPRNGLADYLQIDYASVSRLISGQRLLSPNEHALARGYFSIVPAVQADVLEAIAELRSAKVREFAAAELLRWFAEQATFALANSYGRLIQSRIASQTLRSDQVVVICRVAGLDVRPLTAGYPLETYRWPQTSQSGHESDGLSAISAAARDWARGENLLPYEFDRGRRSRSAGSKRSKTVHRVRIAPVSAPTFEFERCSAFVVLESKKLPFAASREIYLAPLGTEIREGDLIAVLRKNETDALFGKLSLFKGNLIVLEFADGKLEEIALGSHVELRRVAFCRV
jgi:hypothetical protein